MATTDLGKWMITNGGEYNPDTTYEQLTMVLYENSTYITLRTVTGITPNNDKINYILMAQGFSANALADVVATDTYGAIGNVGESVSAQSLIDYLTNEVVNNLIKKTSISTVQVNSDNMVPSSSLVYAMQNAIGDINSNLDDRTAVADILAIANAGPSGRRIVNCGGNTLNTPYKAGLTTLQSGTAVVCMSSANYGTILYVAAGTDAVFLRPKVDGTWKDWERLLTNADYNVQSITNQYGLNLHLVKFGNDNLKVIRLSGYINKALTAGTEYIIASNVSLKSRVDWYHNVFVSGKGSELTVYLNIDNDGNVKITPKTAIASGTAINMMEYYV